MSHVRRNIQAKRRRQRRWKAWDRKYPWRIALDRSDMTQAMREHCDLLAGNSNWHGAIFNRSTYKRLSRTRPNSASR